MTQKSESTIVNPPVKYAPSFWMFCLLMLFLLCVVRGVEEIQDNVAGLAVLEAVTEANNHIYDSRFLLGDHTVPEPTTANKVIDIWSVGERGEGNYLYALALYILADYDAVVDEVVTDEANFSPPLGSLLLGQARYSLGDPEEAGETWRRIDLDVPLRALANQDLRTGRYESALSLYRRLEAVLPFDDEVQVKLGDIYRIMQSPDYGLAVSHYQRAAQLGHDPDRIELLILITDLARTRSATSARSHLERILARPHLTPENKVLALRVIHNVYRYYFKDMARAASYLELAVGEPRPKGDIWDELQLAQLALEGNDCVAARRWATNAERRFLVDASPLAQLRYLEQKVETACGHSDP